MSASTDRPPVHVAAGAGGWTYVWDHRRKLHLHPVATPSGRVLTRVEPPDHPWQRGLWFVVKFIDGENPPPDPALPPCVAATASPRDNFWEEGGPAGWGVQRHEVPPEVTATSVTGDLVWIRPDRTTVAVQEHRRLDHVALGDDAYAIDWDVTLRVPTDAVLDRSPYSGTWGGYSGLAFRGRDDWRDTRLLLDDGVARDRVAPVRSRWCDLSGMVDGEPGGVCILDHPTNPSHPVPFYATTRAGPGYGEGWANTMYPAFLWDGPMHLPASDELRFRYRVVIHDGSWNTPQATTAWNTFAAT